MTGGRPIAFDVTHLVSRLNRRAMTGIDRVDLAYAQHFAANRLIDCGLHYGWRAPHMFNPPRVRSLVERFTRKVGDVDGQLTDPIWEDLQVWLTSNASPTSRPQSSAAATVHRADEGWRAFFDQCAMRVVHDMRHNVPQRAIYLNIAQSAFEHHRFFEWLDRRPDITPVFLVHDLLPLDHPEFFRDGYEGRFDRRVETIIRHAGAIIVTSAVVRDRVVAEYARRNVSVPPIHIQHLPSPLGDNRAEADEDAELTTNPYFVFVGTIEPRKNHKMILNVWRELAENAPKLVLVGVNGWDNGPTLNLLERSPVLRNSIRHVSGLSRPAMRKLIANARAVLLPSFAEGYGLPIVEALSLDAPIIASDIPIFREIAANAATFISPIDGVGWKKIVEDFMRPQSAILHDARQRAQAFMAPSRRAYFSEIEGFLGRL
jgi:glycosyltransferase involved in cell wall biosynthesis